MLYIYITHAVDHYTTTATNKTRGATGLFPSIGENKLLDLIIARNTNTRSQYVTHLRIIQLQIHGRELLLSVCMSLTGRIKRQLLLCVWVTIILALQCIGNTNTTE